MNKKIVLMVGAGCILICLVCGAAYLIVHNSLKYITSSDVEVKNISVKESLPLNVKIGERFVVELQIKNSINAVQELDSIDIYRTYLDGFTLNNSYPQNIGVREITFGPHYYSYDFKQEIPANGSLTVDFNLTAAEEGNYSGMVFVCVNSPTLCNIYYVHSIVGR